MSQTTNLSDDANRFHHFAADNFFKQNYCKLIYQYLIYCNINIVQASTYGSYLHKLLIIQNKCASLATSSNYLAPSAPLFKKLNLVCLRH